MTSSTLEPAGTTGVLVCHNISCWMNGGDDLLSAFCEATGTDRARRRHHGGATSPDGEFYVQGFECLGACDMAPMASIDEVYFGPLEISERPGRGRAAALGGPTSCPTRRSPAARRRRRARARARPARRRGGAVAEETRILFRNVDDPKLRTHGGLPGARRLRGADARVPGPRARRAPRATSRRPGCVAAAAPGSRWARRPASSHAGDTEKYLCCNADESEPGTFKDRELMQKNPHQLIEGCLIASLAAGARYAFIFIRGEYWEIADVLDAAVAEAYDAGFAGENILGTGADDRHRRPPRRRRLHLRRGDRPARLARGQARKPAPEAPLPRDPGPLRRPDADQQRRDAGQPPAHRQQRRRLVHGLRHRAVARHQGRLDLRLRPAARQLRDRAGHARRARSSRAWRADRRPGSTVKAGSPAGRRPPC